MTQLLQSNPGSKTVAHVDIAIAFLRPISFLLFAFLTYISFSTVVSADPIELTKSKRLSLNHQARFLKKLPRLIGKSKVVGDSTPLHLQLKPDTIDEILMLDQRHKKLERAYRHTSYLGLFSEFSDLDYQDESTLARHAAAYQGIRVVSDFLKTSALRDTYRAIAKQMTVVKERTTVRVSESASGDLDVGDGRSDQGQKLVQFRLRNSARHGPEARLELNESWLLRFEMLNSTAMLEYTNDF